MDFALNFLIIIVAQLAVFIINLIVARQVGPEIFGDFTVATNGLQLIATVITLGIDSIIAYYVPKLYFIKKYEEIGELAWSIKHFLKPFYLAVISLSLLFNLSLIALSHASKNLKLFELSHPLFLFIWGTVFLSLNNIFLQLFRTLGYMRTAVLLNLLQTFSYFLFSLFISYCLYAYFFNGDNHYFAHMMLIGFISSFIITTLVSFFLLKRSYHTSLLKMGPKSQWKNKIWGYTIQSLNKYIFGVIPLLVIEWLGPKEASVGIFYAVSSIISLALIILFPIGILISPEISAAHIQSKEMLKQTIIKNLLICFSLALVVTLFFAFFVEKILSLYGPAFASALPYTYFCLINIITFALSIPLARMIQFSKNGANWGANLTLSLILWQLVTSVILVHYYQLLGAIICYITINIIYVLALTVMAYRLFQRDEFSEKTLLH